MCNLTFRLSLLYLVIKSLCCYCFVLFQFLPSVTTLKAQYFSEKKTCKECRAFVLFSRSNKWQMMASHFVSAIGHFRVPKTYPFKMRPSAQPFLWKWVLFAWEQKMISISKAEHLTSFWYRGLGELGNSLL